MKNRTILATACLAALGAFPIAAIAEDAAVQRTEQRADSSDHAQHMAQHFVKAAANTNMFEIAAAKAALSKVERPEVKEYAQHMIDEHQKAQTMLTEAAKDGKFEVPSQLDEVHQAMLSHLEKTQGRIFERGYVYENVAGHVKAVLMFRDASSELTDPQLKQFATAMLPNLKHHLQEAERLAGMGSEARTAGERISAPSDSNSSSERNVPADASNEAKARAGNRTGNAADSGNPGTVTPRSNQGTSGQSK